MHWLLRGYVVRPMEVTTRGPIARVVLVVLTPDVGVFLVEVILYTFILEGLFRKHYRLQRVVIQREGALSVVSCGTSLGTVPSSYRAG
ncbi:hypothetical protein HAX54_027365, partial [Datura stramonium]|nr:hypothetical protein [Datura stramonium]